MAATILKTDEKEVVEEIEKQIVLSFVTLTRQAKECAGLIDEIEAMNPKADTNNVSIAMTNLLKDGTLEEVRIEIKEGGRIGVMLTEKGSGQRDSLLRGKRK